MDSRLSIVKSADSSADSSADPPKVGMWVRVLKVM